MQAQKTELINICDLKNLQQWMRRFNISKEELLEAVEKFGPSAEAISIGLKKSDTGGAYLN
jgi:hypothetical protein